MIAALIAELTILLFDFLLELLLSRSELTRGGERISKKKYGETTTNDQQPSSHQEWVKTKGNEYGHKGRVLAPVIGRYGGASSDLSLILDLAARELARKHTAFYNTCFSEAEAMFKQKLARKWGHAIARG